MGATCNIRIHNLNEFDFYTNEEGHEINGNIILNLNTFIFSEV